ncbi:alginate O-acetylation protein AlgJ [Legionella busanensis]|uniref:Alginate O-acetylation protein AlgJ n=1 Tax=Legionella busanensis TaxID=190655 RepID=A0A378JHH5_9GAMM|nr:alginate O-acetyltransferase [Legionella busanensis]STX50231.1 alginate O-acetylation protein AlgJ [Legionella busanensis]
MKITDKILILTFIIFIFAPSIGLFIKKDPEQIRTMLNREPNNFPGINIKRLGKTNFKGIEGWFADQALLITPLSKLWSHLNYSLSISSKPRETIIGKNGWLFLGNAYNLALDQYNGKKPPTSEEIANTLAQFKKMDAIAKENKILFVVTIAPDKHTVYPEYLPTYIKKSPLPTRYDLIAKELKANNIHFIDLREIEQQSKLTLGKKYGDIYYKCDSHWNFLGAYAAYQAIANYLNKLGIKIDKINYGFIPKKYKSGDLASFLQIDSCESNSPTPDTSNLAINLWEKGETGLKKVEPFNIVDNFIIKPHQVINKAVNNNLTSLVIGDSFSYALMFFLHNSFHSSVRVHVYNRNTKFSELVKDYHPDVIIFELVERSLKSFSTELL